MDDGPDRVPGPEAFREALGHYPTGVVVVTAIADDGEPVGMVLGSFTSVSLDPPLVGFFPARTSSSYQRLRTSSSFCVNVLAADQEDICRRFAAKDATSKYAGVSWSPARSGSPVLDGVVAWIDCEVDAVHEAGDHYLVLGRVTGLGVPNPRLPLLFFQGGYGHFTSSSVLLSQETDLIPAIQLAERARPHMERLVARHGIGCSVLARHGAEMVLVATAGGASSPVPVLGRRIPIVPPFGALFVADAGDDAEREWLDRAPVQTDEARRAHAARLDRVRRRGWSIALDDGRYRDIAAVVDKFSDGVARTPAVERQLRQSIAGLDDLYDGEDLDPAGMYRVHYLAAPVRGADGRVRLMLRLDDLPGPVPAARVDELARELVETASRSRISTEII